jgi:DNA-binding CsgD family transcriptional regulator
MPEPTPAESDRVRLNGTPLLSARELQALRQLAEGRSTGQIAAEMSISSNTVRARIRHLLAKLDVTDRQQVASRAQELGLL